MSRLIILIPAILILVFMACNDDSDPGQNGNNGGGTLELISPAFADNVYHEEVQFQWTTDEEGPYTLQIALDSNFTDVYIDTTTNLTQITIPELQPYAQYFWKISTDNIEASSDFTTENILLNLSDFNGDASVREYVQEPMAGIGLDTTYSEFIEFSFDNDELTITSEFGSFSSVYEYGGINIDTKRAYFNEGGGGSNFRTMEYFYSNDSIYIRRHSGGIAGGTRWMTSIKK